MRYEGLFIYVLQFDTTFQYLFALDQDIFQHHISLKPMLWNRVLWMIGKRFTPYLPKELDEGEQIILSSAMQTIDRIKKEGKLTRQGRRERSREMEQIEAERAAKKHIPCQWQARETIDGWYYMCLVHGMAVKMQDNEKPHHD